MNEDDIVDLAAGLPAGSPLATLRRQRPDFVRHTQGSLDVLITPGDPGGVSLIERAAAALRVAAIERDPALIERYRGLLGEAGADAATMDAAGNGGQTAAQRLDTILRHVTLITTAPGSATRAQLDTLRDAGLAPRDIVTIAQIVAFVSYQVRVVAGLRLLAEESRA